MKPMTLQTSLRFFRRVILREGPQDKRYLIDLMDQQLTSVTGSRSNQRRHLDWLLEHGRLVYRRGSCRVVTLPGVEAGRVGLMEWALCSGEMV